MGSGIHSASVPARLRRDQRYLDIPVPMRWIRLNYRHPARGTKPFQSPTQTVSAALNIIADHVSEGEMNDIKGSLPEDIRKLWDD